MGEIVLVTGGAGFIGSELCRALLTNGYRVRVLDNFNPQIHGIHADLSTDLKSHVELIRADVRDENALARGLLDAEAVVHLAAETGTGQSMYEIERYFSVNVQGTATFLELLQNHTSGRSVRSVVVASSRALYGEGSYKCSVHGLIFPESRSHEQLSCGDFELHCPECGGIVQMLPTEETAPFRPLSIYGLTKQVQEQSILMLARTRGINGFALRYQNVYGPGQSLKNPYTGILSVFSNLARHGQPLEVYEDGLESRDFVFVSDIVEATLRSVSYNDKFVGALNVGYGEAVTVNTVASEINRHFGDRSEIRITGAFRLGDIRHNKASIIRIKSLLGFSPSVEFKDGLQRFLTWVETQPMEDKLAYRRSIAELQDHGIMGKGKV